MKPVIEAIDLQFDPNDQFAAGLHSIRMKSIKGTAVIAGANGSGKTRLLRFLQKYLSGQIVGQIGPHPSQKSHKNKYQLGIVGADGYQDTHQVIWVPNGIQLGIANTGNSTENDRSTAREMHINRATSFEETLAHVLRSALAVASDFVDVSNPHFQMDDDEKEARIHRWQSLTSIVDRLLGRELAFNNQRQLLIGGKFADNAYSDFSDGEKRLFQFAVTLAGTSQPGKSQIVLFDEPETSLHPKAAIEMIRQMQVVVDGQIWIATHSVPLIAALGMENVWYAKDGTISYGGRRTERVINSLMGGRDNLFALRDLIAEPDRVALAKFAAECLKAPEVVAAAGPDDPQMQQVAPEVEPAKGKKESITVLDWGCGKARVKVWLDLYSHDLAINVEYWGYERDAATAVEARKNAARGIGPEAKIFDDCTQLEKELGPRRFDVVILANVLHEIEPAEWLDTFKIISSLLAPNGKLLILEDSMLPVGELPHATGFLLLDKMACTKIFRATESELRVLEPADTSLKDRLLGISIPRDVLSRTDDASVRLCVEYLRDTLLIAIDDHRHQALGSESKVDYETGLKHALAVVQYANAQLALRKLP